MPRGDVNVPSDYFSLAGFEVIMHGRFWVLTEDSRVFRTQGHPKAKGVDFQVRYPASWRPAEGERPNIIQKFVSENGRGLESIMLVVKDIPLPEDYKPTKRELDEFFSDK